MAEPLSTDSDLRDLADLAGIEPDYWDIQGVRHETSPQTARTLLSALGFPADDPTAVSASLAALKNDAWRRVLPPVLVCRQGTEAVVSVNLPDGRGTTGLAWWVVLEDGTVLDVGAHFDLVSTSSTHWVEGREIRRYTLSLPVEVPLGYHSFNLSGDDVATMPLIVAPPQCYFPAALDAHGRRWGIAAQLYALRSRRNWGIGDFTDLGTLIELAAKLGADAIGFNPLHALFPATPEHVSPYSPSSRLFRNFLYLDVTAVADFAEAERAQQLALSGRGSGGSDSGRGSDFVDYVSVSRLKLHALEQVYDAFQWHHLTKPGDVRAAAFRRFQATHGDQLRRFAAFQRLSEVFGTHDWSRWPPAYRNPSSAAVDIFVHEHQRRIEFFEYLQWQADAQQAVAHQRSRHSGMAIGLYGDLAVSADPMGADVWSAQELFARDVHIGAPPDPFNAVGQDWHLAPLNPLRLRATGYAHFIELLRANMRHVDALRVDHIMGLQRLFWVPRGAAPPDGAYVNYPLEDLIAILALESQRNECLTVGEDLGTVPQGLRARLADAGVLSSRVLYFEKVGDRFTSPEDYPYLATASIATHDLATLRGFWEGSDLEHRNRLGLFHSEADRLAAEAERERDRRALLQVLADADLLPADVDLQSLTSVPMSSDLVMAVHAFLARSSACLFMVSLDDLTGETDQPNLPGTSHEYPNWRRRLHRRLEELAGDRDVDELAARISRARAARIPAPSTGTPDILN